MPATTATATKHSSTSSSKPAFLEVIDPCNRTGKVTIPMEHIQETRGMNEQTRPKDAKDLSLCLLFQKGKCNAGARCHQVHADVQFVTKLRNQATSGSACCALHGDFNSASYLTSNVTVDLLTNGVPTKYALSAFGRTQTLETLLCNAQAHASKTIRINANKICRLHSQSRCKFGKDCKNIHLCPDAKPATTSTSTAAAAAATKPQPLAPFAHPSSSSPASLNTTSRKMKNAPVLEVTKAELAKLATATDASSSFASSSSSSAGSSTPRTEAAAMTKSIRSVMSAESESNNGLSAAATPNENELTPKERTIPSLFNRSTPPATPPPATEAKKAFASEFDRVYTTPKKHTTGVPAPLTTSVSAPSLWQGTPLKTVATPDLEGFDPCGLTHAIAQELGSIPSSAAVLSPLF